MNIGLAQPSHINLLCKILHVEVPPSFVERAQISGSIIIKQSSVTTFIEDVDAEPALFFPIWKLFTAAKYLEANQDWPTECLVVDGVQEWFPANIANKVELIETLKRHSITDLMMFHLDPSTFASLLNTSPVKLNTVKIAFIKHYLHSHGE